MPSSPPPVHNYTWNVEQAYVLAVSGVDGAALAKMSPACA